VDAYLDEYSVFDFILTLLFFQLLKNNASSQSHLDLFLELVTDGNNYLEINWKIADFMHYVIAIVDYSGE